MRYIHYYYVHLGLPSPLISLISALGRAEHVADLLVHGGSHAVYGNYPSYLTNVRYCNASEWEHGVGGCLVAAYVYASVSIII